MGDNFEHNKPYSLAAAYQDSPAPTALTAPYDLHATFLGVPETGLPITQYVGALGFATSDFGVGRLISPQFVQPSGVASRLAFGTTWVSNYTRTLPPQGIASRAVLGRPVAYWPYPQTAAPKSLTPLVFGDPFVDQTIRRITLSTGVNTHTVDAPRIWFHTRGVYVQGSDYLRVGELRIEHEVVVTPTNQNVGVPGADVALYGRARVENFFKTVYPDGLNALRIPTPDVEERDSRRFVYVNGMSTYVVNTPHITQPYQLVGSKFWGDPQPSAQVGEQTVFGLHTLDWYTRYLEASGRASSTVSTRAEIRDRAFYPQALPAAQGECFGGLIVTHEVRSLRLGGFETAAYGAPQFRLEKASIYPNFLFAFGSGQPTVSDGVRELKVGGVSSSEAVGGRLRIERHTRAVFASSWASVGFSPYTNIRDARQYIRVFSIVPPDFLVNSVVINRNIHIVVHSYAPSGVEVALFGTAFIRDRALQIRPSGVDRLRFGLGASIDYYTGDISYVYVNNRTLFGQGVVGHYVRWVHPEGVLMELISRHAHIRNTAFLVRVVGFGDTRLGASAVYNRNRTVRVSSVSDWAIVGVSAFVAYHTREISAFGIRPTTYIPQTHWVSTLVRTIAPQGMFENTMSARWETEVYERFNRLRPYWISPTRPLLGEPAVVLRNKTLGPYGYDYFESGRAHVELYDRLLGEAGLGQTQLFGRALIRDRRLEVRLTGFSISTTTISRNLTVRNLLPDPPWPRELRVGGYDMQNRAGVPRVRGNVVYPSSVYGGSAFSSPTLRRNSIIVDTGISEYNWGSLIAGGPQFLTTVAFNVAVVGRPRMTPYNIYASAGDQTPAGYNPEINTGGTEHVVDYYAGAFATSDKNSLAWIPGPRVDHFHRDLWVSGISPPWPDYWNPRPIVVRNALIPKERQFVQHRGASFMRLGWVTLSPFPQEIMVLGVPPLSVGVARAVGAELFIRHLRPAGLNGFAMATPWVSLYNRFVQGLGVDVSLYGSAIVWFAKRSVYPSGVGSRVLLSNSAWVSNRVRTVAPVGEEMFNPEVAFYKNTTKVQNQHQGVVLSAKSFVSSSFGSLDVGLYTKYVRHAGGIFPIPANRVRVKSRLALSAQGFETLQFGDVRKWEDGFIQVHETTSGVVSMPMISTPHQVQGFTSSMVDYPVIAAHIGPQGIESEGTGATVFKNEICCGGCE